MKHQGTKKIETDRLILRQFSTEDADSMYNNWAKDPEVTKYLMWPYHKSVEVSNGVLSDWIPLYAQDDYYQWAIVLKMSDEAIGSIAVVLKDDAVEMVHIGYCIGRKWWNQGITSEALAALVRFFFDEVGVNRMPVPTFRSDRERIMVAQAVFVTYTLYIVRLISEDVIEDWYLPRPFKLVYTYLSNRNHPRTRFIRPLAMASARMSSQQQTSLSQLRISPFFRP